MTEARTDGLRRFRAVFYFVAVLMVVTPVIDFAMNVMPWNVREIQWRYGAVGLVSGFIMTSLLGALMWAALAAWYGDRTLQKISGAIWLAGGLFLLIACGGFALDMIQLRASVPTDQRTGFDLAGLKALGKNTVAALTFAWLGVVAVRTRRGRGQEQNRVMVQFPGDDA